MAVTYSREQVDDGIFFTTLINKRSKTNSIIVYFLTPLEKETAPVNAIISHILAESSSRYPTKTLMNKKLSELYGSFIRGSVSKMGDSQVITLTANCINNKYTFDGEKITEELTQILADCLISPNVTENGFEAKDFELKKQELLDDIDAEINEKRAYAFKRANKTIFRNEPAAVSVLGDRENAEKLAPYSSYEHYLELIRSARAEIIFVGAEYPEECKNILKNAFEKIDRNYNGCTGSKRSPLKSEPCDVTETYDVVQSKMIMAFKTDHENLAALKLMNAIFGATPISKLFMNVREKLSLCYYCSSGINDKKGVVYVDSGVEHSNIEKAKAEILSQLDAMKKGDFSDEEFNNARLAIINSWKGVNDSVNSIADWYFDRIYSGNIKSPEQEIELLMKVTREDIISAANSLALDTVYILTGKGENE